MKEFLRHGEFAYHAGGSYIPSVDSYGVSITSTFSASKDPDYHRKVLQLNLSGQELDALITTLQNVRASKPASLPVEEYGWLKTDDAGATVGEELKPVIVGFSRLKIIDERKVWSGYEEGRKVREALQISRLDEIDCPVSVVIPEHVWTFTSNYFRGLFGESVETLGYSAFRNKYKFYGKPDIMTMVGYYIENNYQSYPWHK